MNIGLINKNTKNTDTHGYAILNYTSRNTDSHKKLIILLDISQTLQILTDIFSGHSKTSYGSFIYSTIGGLLPLSIFRDVIYYSALQRIISYCFEIRIYSVSNKAIAVHIRNTIRCSLLTTGMRYIREIKDF